MSGDTFLSAYEAVTDEPNRSTLSNKKLRACHNIGQELKKHAQDQQPLEACREDQELGLGDTPEEGKQLVLKQSPHSVALPSRLRGTPTAPTKPEVPPSSESWGKDTLQSLGIKDESPPTTADGENMLTGEVPAGAMHKLATELHKGVHSSEGCSLHKALSPPSLFGNNDPFFQGSKDLCLLVSGDSSQQPPCPAKDCETSPYDTMRAPWVTSNVRQPMQPTVPSFSGPASREVSAQTLRDFRLAGVRPGSGLMQRQQAGIHPADSSISQHTAFQQEIAADRQKSMDVYAPTPTHIQRQNVEGGIWGPDLYRGANPQMQLQGPASSNVANGQAGGDHVLQTYSMQLMRLEQQNKKRLLRARQEQDAVDRKRDSQADSNDASLLQQHHQQSDPQQQPNSVQQSPQQQPQQTDLQQQPEPVLSSARDHPQLKDQQQQHVPVLLGAKQQWQWLRGRTRQHFQDLLTSAAQKYGGNPAAVPPSVRLDCLQRAKEMAEEQIPMDYIMKCGPYARDPQQVNQRLPDHGIQAEPQSRSNPKAEANSFESSKIAESKRTRGQRHQSQRRHKVVAGRGEPTVNAYTNMAANAFDQDRERRERKNFNLFSSLETDFKLAQDRLLKSTEAQVRYLRYPGFCDAVNRLRDQQRRTFDEALATAGSERRGEGQDAAGVKKEEMDQGEKDFAEGSAEEVVKSRLPERSLAQHAPTLAPVPMRWNATSMPPLSGKVLPREPSHTAHSSAEDRSVKTSDETRIAMRKASYNSWVAEEAEKLRKDAQKAAVDKAEELRKQYEAESKNREPKHTYTIPEQQTRTWIYRHGAYTFHERAQFIQYRHGYIYLRNIAAGVSMLARHLRCFDKVDIEHVEQLTGLCLYHFKPDSPRMWTFRHGSDTVEIEAQFLDYRDGYVSLRQTGTEGTEFVHKRIEDFPTGDMRYIGSIRSRDFEMSRAVPGVMEEGGRGRGQGQGRGDDEKEEVGSEGTIKGQDQDRIEVEAREEVEGEDKMEVEVEAREEVEYKNKMEVEDEAKAANDTAAPQSDDGDIEWDRVDEMNVSSGEEWTEIDEEMVEHE